MEDSKEGPEYPAQLTKSDTKQCDLALDTGRSLVGKNSRNYKMSMLQEAEKTQTSEIVFKLWTIIHPQSKFKKIWDSILIILLLYVAIIMPYRIAFIDGQIFDSWWWIDTCINGLFILDFFINLFLAYYDESGKLVFSHYRIFLNYLKGWMLIDLISCIPYDLIFESSSSNSVKYNNLLRIFRLPRLYRLLRISKIFKLMKQYKNSELVQKFQDFLNIKQSVARLIGTFFMVVVFVHIYACLWAFAPKLEDYDLDTWIVKGKFYNDDNQYILSLYWCIVTFSTVGYGDIVPGNSFEMFLAIFWMIFGICFYSFIIGSLASILTGIETKESILIRKLATIDEFSKENNFSKDLKMKIRNFVKSLSEFEGFRWDDKKNIYFDLPKNLRFEIAKVMHKGCADFLSFFKYRDSSFVSAVVPFLSHCIVLPNEYVYEINDYANDIYFLMRGKVSLLSRNEIEEMPLLSFFPGSCFGEIEVTKRCNRLYYVKTDTKCSLLVMNYELIEYVQNNFQNIWSEVVLQAEETAEIFEALEKHIKKLRKIDKKELGLKNLKDAADYAEGLVKKEFSRRKRKIKTENPEEKVREAFGDIVKNIKEIVNIANEVDGDIEQLIESVPPLKYPASASSLLDVNLRVPYLNFEDDVD